MVKRKRPDNAEIIDTYSKRFRASITSVSSRPSDAEEDPLIYDDLREETLRNDLEPDDWIEIFNGLHDAIETSVLLMRVVGPANSEYSDNSQHIETDITAGGRYQALYLLEFLAKIYFREYYSHLWKENDLEAKIREVDLLLLRLYRFPYSFSKTCITEVISRLKDTLTAQHNILAEEHERRKRRGTDNSDPSTDSFASGKEARDASAEGEERINKPLLTVDQFIMLIFAIGGSRLKGLDKKKVANGLSALTGNATTSFVNRFAEILSNDAGVKKFTTKPDIYNNDVEKVCRILENMGLTDEVQKLKSTSGV